MEIANFDFSNLPIVVITVTPVEPTEATYDEFLRKMSKTVNEAVEKIAIITDLTQGKYLKSELRIKMGNWLKDNEVLLKEKVEVMCLVNKSAIVNIVIKGVFLIKKPAVPTQIFSTLEQAIQWSDEKLAVLS